MASVVYNVSQAGDGWRIHLAGDGVTEYAPSKQEAVRRAKELGKRHSEWTGRVLNPSGSLETEYTFTPTESRR